MDKKENVLVVEDNHESLSFLTKLLNKEGFNTFPADSGELAIASLENNIPDLILLDIQMPGISGFEVCQQIKLKKELADIPIIFLTAATEVNDKLEGLRLGAVDYITKPFRKEELLARLKTHLKLFRYNQLFKERTAEKIIKNEKILREKNEALKKYNEKLRATSEALKESNNELNIEKEKSKENEAKFRTIFENSKDAIGVSKKGINIFFNSAYVKLFGYENQDELIGKPIIEHIAVSERIKIQEYVQKRSSGQTVPNCYESIGLRKNGEEFYFEIVVNEAVLSKEKHSVVIIRETTKSKKIQEKLKKQNQEYAFLTEKYKIQNVELKKAKEKAEENERLFKDLVESSQNLIWKCDLQGKFTYLNAAWEHTHGYKLHEMLNRPFSDFQRPEVFERDVIEFTKHLKGGFVKGYETFHIRKDGTEIPLIFNALPLFNNKGEIIGTQGTAFNISVLKSTEKQLIKAKERAEESDRLKTEFINNMSHEIKTPMNGILGFSRMLNKPGKSEEKKKHFISIIQNSGNQLMRIIDDILEISKLETKQVVAKNENLCLNDLLLQLFSIFDIKAKENRTPLYLKKGLSDQESTIFADESKLNKILSNLLENALKFTVSGFIEFGYRILPVGTDLPDGTSQQKGTFLQLYVKDTGIGIASSKQESIFERFSQANKDLSRKAGGLGLGLSIAKENAELIGGEITLKSKKGKGSTFYVTVPYNTVTSIEPNIKQSSIKSLKSKIENQAILIVEDEEVNYLYLETVLEDELKLSQKILHAKNGREAVEMCKRKPEISLVLMDLKLPLMNGFEATKQIKKFRPDLPIVAQTAYSTKSEKKEALAAGCDDFISKPIKEETLNEIIEKFLKQKIQYETL